MLIHSFSYSFSRNVKLVSSFNLVNMLMYFYSFFSKYVDLLLVIVLGSVNKN